MDGLTVEALGTVAGATAFIYLAMAGLLKPLVDKKSDAWKEKYAGLAQNFGAVVFGQVAIAVAGFAVKASTFAEWANLSLVGLVAFGVSTGIYEVKKNVGKAASS